MLLLPPLWQAHPCKAMRSRNNRRHTHRRATRNRNSLSIHSSQRILRKVMHNLSNLCIRLNLKVMRLPNRNNRSMRSRNPI